MKKWFLIQAIIFLVFSSTNAFANDKGKSGKQRSRPAVQGQKSKRVWDDTDIVHFKRKRGNNRSRAVTNGKSEGFYIDDIIIGARKPR